MIDKRTTVVIATRNRPAELARTLAQLSALRPSPPVIVVDNGSAEAITGPWRYPGPVRVIALDRNHGAAARTIGAAHAGTPYVAFSDDDSWWAPAALRIAADTFDRHPGLALVAARTLVGPERRPDPVNQAMADSPLAAADDLPGRPVLGCVACATVVRREAFLAAGGFSRLLFFRGEETLLCYDLAAAGWALRYLDRVVAYHHPSPARPDRWRQLAVEHRNRLLTMWLRRPLPLAATATWRLGRRAYADRAALAALAGLARRLPAALAARRPLPAAVERDAWLLDAAAIGGRRRAALLPAAPR